MRKIVFIVVAVLMSISLFAKDGEIIGTFMGVNENDEYVFQLDSGATITFQDIDYDIEIDLFDKELIGKKFKVIWEYYSDEEEEESPEIKKIIALEEY